MPTRGKPYSFSNRARATPPIHEPHPNQPILPSDDCTRRSRPIVVPAVQSHELGIGRARARHSFARRHGGRLRVLRRTRERCQMTASFVIEPTLRERAEHPLTFALPFEPREPSEQLVGLEDHFRNDLT